FSAPLLGPVNSPPDCFRCGASPCLTFCLGHQLVRGRLLIDPPQAPGTRFVSRVACKFTDWFREPSAFCSHQHRGVETREEVMAYVAYALPPLTREVRASNA